MDTIVLVTLEYNDMVYTFKENFGKNYPRESVEFMYEDGNYSCDCNKSLDIKRNCDDAFKEMCCGEFIKLVNIEFIQINKEIPPKYTKEYDEWNSKQKEGYNGRDKRNSNSTQDN